MLTRIHSVFVFTIGMALVVAACGGGSSAPAGPAANAKADGPGVITGKISLEGEAPGRTVIRMGADPNCMPKEPVSVGAVKGALSETVLVGSGGGLKNVFVYVKDGLGNRVYETPKAEVVLDQHGCQYEPHVFGVFVGQPVRIKNSDPTLHNVHAIPKSNQEFNFGQQPKAEDFVKTFDKPEIGLSFRCDVHGWMRAYANVVTHPFFAVTNDDGSFELKGLPPGTYTIEAWHEKFGTQTQQVTISDGAPKATADFNFKQV